MFVRPIRLLFVALMSLSVAAAPAPVSAGKVVAAHTNISYSQWTTGADFASGTSSGAVPAGDAITFGSAAGSIAYDDQGFGFPTRTYDTATWTSPVRAPGRWRRGVVQSDLDRDGGRVLRQVPVGRQLGAAPAARQSER